MGHLCQWRGLIITTQGGRELFLGTLALKGRECGGRRRLGAAICAPRVIALAYHSLRAVHRLGTTGRRRCASAADSRIIQEQGQSWQLLFSHGAHAVSNLTGAQNVPVMKTRTALYYTVLYS